MLTLFDFVQVAPVTTAPWWGVPIVAGSFLLLGGLLGGGISFFSTWKADQRRGRREDRQRWDRDLLERAGRVIVATDRAYEANYNLQHAINVDHAKGVHGSSEVSAALVESRQAINEFVAARAAVTLIADGPVTVACLDLGTPLVSVQATAPTTELPPAAIDGALVAKFVTAVRTATGVEAVVHLKR